MARVKCKACNGTGTYIKYSPEPLGEDTLELCGSCGGVGSIDTDPLDFGKGWLIPPGKSWTKYGGPEDSWDEFQKHNQEIGRRIIEEYLLKTAVRITVREGWPESVLITATAARNLLL